MKVFNYFLNNKFTVSIINKIRCILLNYSFNIKLTHLLILRILNAGRYRWKNVLRPWCWIILSTGKVASVCGSIFRGTIRWVTQIMRRRWWIWRIMRQRSCVVSIWCMVCIRIVRCRCWILMSIPVWNRMIRSRRWQSSIFGSCYGCNDDLKQNKFITQ